MEKKEIVSNKISSEDAVNAYKSLKIAKILYLTKNGKLYSPLANEYANKLKRYSVFCILQKQEEWSNLIDKLMEKVGIITEEDFVEYAYDLECAGLIIELMFKNYKWENIHEIVLNQNHSNITMSSMTQLILLYSDHGVEFVEKEFKENLIAFRNLNILYKKTKKQDTKKKQEELVLVLRKFRDKKS